MASINGLDKMSYSDLLKFDEKIKDAIAEKRTTEAASTKEQLRALAEKSGFSLQELFGGKRGPRKASEVKYRNPKDPTQTWTGRGRKPNWLVDALKKGAKIDSFAV
jgi:DNA-binding protein H-NS